MGKIPASVSDVLLHDKNTDRTERVIMPITRYKNVLNAPALVKSAQSLKGAPFLLLQTGTETLSTADLRNLVGDIV